MLIEGNMFGWQMVNKNKSTENDSSYRSFINLECDSSINSLNLSLSSMDDQPSTSGCSSEIGFSARMKEMKKEKVKEFLKELKSLVPSGSDQNRKVGTLSALQHVVNSMKKMQDDPHLDHSRQLCPSQPGDSSSASESQLTKLSVMVSLRKHVVHQVSSGLMQTLNYPKDFWKGRLLTDFILKKDSVTFINNVLDDNVHDGTTSDRNCDSKGNREISKKSFYIRFRCFKTLFSGFTLNQMPTYIPFRVTLNLRTFDLSGDDRRGRSKTFMYLECLPLESPYKDGRLPKQCTFTTEHSPSCTFTHVHSNAIGLLGYLPQDILGASIFDFYHPDDLPKLLEVHKQVIGSMGQLYKVEKIKVKCRNGDWVEVDTDWSGSVNPWTGQLELFIGRHTIVKGPCKTNIFEDASVSTQKPFLSESIEKNTRKIWNLIQNMIEETWSSVQVKTEPSFVTPQVDSTRPGSDSEGPDVMMAKTTPQLKTELPMFRDGRPTARNEHSNSLHDFNTSEVYDQLNYSQNIKRFLLSQSKFSEMSGGKGMKLSPSESSIPLNDQDGTDFAVNIPFCKPPSIGSSTLVHVSEHGEDTIRIPSPSHPYCQEETWKVPSTKASPTPHIQLTREALQKHTKLQEELLVEQARTDDSIFILDNGDYTLKIKEETNFKRPHSKIGSHSSVDKEYCSKNPRMEQLPFEKSTDSLARKSSKGPALCLQPQLETCDSLGQPRQQDFIAPGMHPNLGMFPHQFPMMQFDPVTLGLAPGILPVSSQSVSPVEGLPQSTRPASLPGIQWPYYPQTGVSFVPQVMEGFYQPLTGMFQPFTVPSIYSHAMSMHAQRMQSPQPQYSHNHHSSDERLYEHKLLQKRSDESRDSLGSIMTCTTSNNDTTSSVMYLLEATTTRNSSKEDYEKGSRSMLNVQKQKREILPSWLMNVHWNTHTKMRYTLPNKKLKNVLRADRNSMARYTQSEDSVLQLEEILETIMASNSDPVLDEESDCLFYLEKDESNAEVPVSHVGCYGDNSVGVPSHRISHLLPYETSKSQKKGTHRSSENGEIQAMSCEWQDNTEAQENLFPGSPNTVKESCSSDEGNDNADFKQESDSGVSKDTSVITPSDERSMEEVSSSLKESSGESEVETTKEDSYFEKLFVRLPIDLSRQRRSLRHLPQPFWLQEVEMTEKISKEFQMKSVDIESILGADQRRLRGLTQSPLILQQLNELKESNTAFANSSAMATDGKHTGDMSVGEEIKQDNIDVGPKFVIDKSIFENLFLPTGAASATNEMG